MSKILVAASLIVAGATFAFDDCSCVCGNGQNRRVVSDGRMMNDAQANSDGYFLRDGRVMVSRGGNPTELTQEVVLDNGMRLEPDGVLILSDGSRSRFRDNQWVTFDGHFIERDRASVNASFREQHTRDGYFIQNGKVMSFRNGNVTEITTDTTLDNGTRIMADGTVIMKDGTRSRLGEKQWMTTDGRLNDNANRDNSATRDVSHNRNDQTNEQHRIDANVNRNNANVNIQNNQETHRENSVDVRRNNEAPHNDAALKNEQNRGQVERHENVTPNAVQHNDAALKTEQNQAGRREVKAEGTTKTDVTPQSEIKRDQTGRVENKPEVNKNSDANSNAGRGDSKKNEEQK